MKYHLHKLDVMKTGWLGSRCIAVAKLAVYDQERGHGRSVRQA